MKRIAFLLIAMSFFASCNSKDHNLSVKSFSDLDGWFISSSSAQFGEGSLVTMRPELAVMKVKSIGNQTDIILSFNWTEASMQVILEDIPPGQDKDAFLIPKSTVNGNVIINEDEHFSESFSIEGAVSLPTQRRASASVSIEGALGHETFTLTINELVVDMTDADFQPSFVTVDRESTLMNVFQNKLEEGVTLTFFGKSKTEKEVLRIEPFSSGQCLEMKKHEWPSLAVCDKLIITKDSGEEVSYNPGEGFLSGSGYEESQRTDHEIRDGVLISFPWKIHTYVIDNTLFTSSNPRSAR